MKLEILFENSHFAILDKPAMVLTTPSREGAGDSRACLGLELQKRVRRQIFPVHRLDFEVSGLVLFAKSAEAHREANDWFEHKLVFKTYQALTGPQDFSHIPASVANPREKLELAVDREFHWRCRLLRGKRRAYEHPTGKPAETFARYLGLGGDGGGSGLRWELHPLTGRPHQLRFELSRHGFPIVGDELYGSRQKFSQPGIALRAVRIDFSKTPGFNKWQLPPTVEAPFLAEFF